ncbi:unnamed protein product, partial [Didymodactylos carnosus]
YLHQEVPLGCLQEMQEKEVSLSCPKNARSWPRNQKKLSLGIPGTILIQNLCMDVSIYDLYETFSHFGIIKVTCICDRKKEAMIAYVNEEDAQAAINCYDNKEVLSNVVRITLATRRGVRNGTEVLKDKVLVPPALFSLLKEALLILECNREDSGSGSYGGDCGWYDDIENRYGDYKSHRRGDGQYRGIVILISELLLCTMPCHLIYADMRPVPLHHYIFSAGAERLHSMVDETVCKFREDKQTKRGGFKNDTNYFKIVKMILKRNLARVIVFSFSKKKSEQVALATAKLDFNSGSAGGVRVEYLATQVKI